MRRYNLLLGLLLTAVVLCASAAAELKRQDEAVSPQKSQLTIDDDDFPLTDFVSQETADAAKRVKRQNKGRKYDKSGVIDPANTVSSTAVRGGAVDVSLPAFPVTQSNVVVIGEITDAQAYLSNDKTGVYSEFSIRIEKVLKNDSGEPIANDNIIEVEREGGRVRLPSGRIFLYSVERQRMPRVRGRYLLFLTRKNQQEEFHILTGYELRGGQVSSLDNLPQPKIYEGANETTFLNELQTILSSSSQTHIL